MAEETYKRLRKNPLSASGKTHDGRIVVSGFFKLVDGQGIPLDILLYYFKDNDLVPDWLGFFMESIETGWNPESTLSKIEVACHDVYGKLHSEEVIDGLELVSGIR